MGSVAGPVIQENRRLTFEDDMWICPESGASRVVYLAANFVHMKLIVQNNDGGFVLPCTNTFVD